MRRILAPVLAASLLMMLPASVSAAAAPVRAGTQAAAGTCEPTKAYPPPGRHAIVQVDTTVPFVGDPLEISGIKYCPDEDVELTIAGQHVGTAHTDADGSFDPEVTTPGPPGPKLVCGIGASGFAFDRDCLTIHVRAVTDSSSAAPVPPVTNGGTAFTGVQIALVGLLALMLVVGGVVVTTLGRNRRPERA